MNQNPTPGQGDLPDSVNTDNPDQPVDTTTSNKRQRMQPGAAKSEGSSLVADDDSDNDTSTTLRRKIPTSSSVSSILPPPQTSAMHSTAAGASLSDSPKANVAGSAGNAANSPDTATVSSDSEENKAAVNRAAQPRFFVPAILAAGGGFVSGFREISLDPESRPGTHLRSEGQGDHTTAYIAIMEMLQSAVAGESINDVKGILGELATFFLDETGHRSIQNTIASLEEGLKKHVIFRDKRKQLTDAMRSFEIARRKGEIPVALQDAAKIIGEQRAHVKLVIKEHESLLLLETISRIAEEIVVLHQTDTLAVMSKKRVASQPSRPGAEGNRIKTAMLNLKLSNHLLAFKRKMADASSDDSKKEALCQDYQEIFIDIITSAKPNITLVATVQKNFNEFLEIFNLEDFALTVTKDSAQKDLDTAFSGINQSWISRLDLGKMTTDRIGNLINDLFDYRYIPSIGQNLAVLTDELDNCCQIAAKHIVCLLMAFKELNHYSTEKKHDIVLKFCQRIIAPIPQGGQGWGDYPIAGIGQLTADKLAEQVLRHIRFSADDCAFIKNPPDNILQANIGPQL